MLKRDVIEKAIFSAAQQQGATLNGKNLLDIRTGVAASPVAKDRQAAHGRANVPMEETGTASIE